MTDVTPMHASGEALDACSPPREYPGQGEGKETPFGASLRDLFAHASGASATGDDPVKRRPGRPATVAHRVMALATPSRTVAQIVSATGLDAGTVRAVLRRASDRGEIRLKRFVSGKSGRTIVVAS